jgi:hypothetical protein
MGAKKKADLPFLGWSKLLFPDATPSYTSYTIQGAFFHEKETGPDAGFPCPHLPPQKRGYEEMIDSFLHSPFDLF